MSQILLSHIASVDKLPSTTAGSTLHIVCKNFHSLTFIIPRERDCHDVYLSLQQLSQPGALFHTCLGVLCLLSITV